MEKLTAKAGEEWRAHWKLVLASAVGISMASMALGSLGAYMQSLEQEFGWSRAQISSGFSIFALAAILLSPVLGTFVDRWGPRRGKVRYHSGAGWYAPQSLGTSCS